jgi:hypothetical protein
MEICNKVIPGRKYGIMGREEPWRRGKEARKKPEGKGRKKGHEENICNIT